MNKRKSTSWAKLKAVSQEKQIQMWKEYFKNLLGNSHKVTDKLITKIINSQLDIKLGQFIQEELNVLLTKIKSRRAADLDEIPPEVWKTRKFDDQLLWFCNTVYEWNTIEKWTKGCILPFDKKGNLGTTKNYRGITLTFIAANVYNPLLCNCIESEIEKILRKNQNSLWRNH